MPNENVAIKYGCLRWCWLALLVVALDQLSKFLVININQSQYCLF